MTVQPDEIVVKALGNGQHAKREVDVYNFSEVDWPRVVVTSSVPWLSAVANSADVARSGGRADPRQKYRIAVDVRPESLPIGRNRGTVSLSVDEPPRFAAKVPVDVIVTSPVKPVPGQLFFGRVAAAREATAELSVVFANEADVVKVEKACVTHDMGDVLRVALRRATERRWNLAVSLRSTKAGYVGGVITITFDDPSLGIIEVPVSAMIDSPNTRTDPKNPDIDGVDHDRSTSGDTFNTHQEV